MSFIHDFKEFVSRGNVVDLAVGVVIGAAFGKIVSALVDNVIMPPIGYVIGGIDFSELVIRIGNPVTDAAGKVTGGAVIHYGVFINTVIQFAIIAFFPKLQTGHRHSEVTSPSPRRFGDSVHEHPSRKPNPERSNSFTDGGLSASSCRNNFRRLLSLEVAQVPAPT